MRKEDYVALAAFRKALRKFLRFADLGAIEAGITPQQHQVLLAIQGQVGRDWASVGELAESLQLKHHAVVGLVNRCQTAGLVVRTADPNDHRSVRVSLTDKGHDILTVLTHRNLDELRYLGRFAAEMQTLAKPQATSDAATDPVGPAEE